MRLESGGVLWVNDRMWTRVRAFEKMVGIRGFF